MKKNIAPYVHHIYINFVANKALFTHKDESKYIELFIKRKLFSRVGFQQFVLKNSFLLGDRDRYYLDELSPTAKEKLGELAKNQEKKTTTEKMYETNATAGKSSIFGNRINEFKVSEFPIKLYSLKDLLDGIEDLNMKFRYKVKVYRYLKQQGISKIKIQSLIRYRREDIESAADFSLPLVVDKEKLLSNIETVICGEDQ